jgi:hypothetical protein
MIRTVFRLLLAVGLGLAYGLVPLALDVFVLGSSYTGLESWSGHGSTYVTCVAVGTALCLVCAIGVWLLFGVRDGRLTRLWAALLFLGASIGGVFLPLALMIAAKAHEPSLYVGDAGFELLVAPLLAGQFLIPPAIAFGVGLIFAGWRRQERPHPQPLSRLRRGEYPIPATAGRKWQVPAIVVLAVILIGLPCVWVAVRKANEGKQQATMQTLKRLDAIVGQDWLGNVVSVTLDSPRITDADLASLSQLPELRTILLMSTAVTGRGAGKLQGLRRLRWLDFGSSPVTDAGLEGCKGLKQLEMLGLGRTQVSDVGLAAIEGLVGLRTLWLEDTQMTDAGLTHLTGLKNLERLYLDNTHVTDAGLKQLMGLPQLKFVGLWNTRVSEDGVNDLRRALPKCQVGH